MKRAVVFIFIVQMCVSPKIPDLFAAMILILIRRQGSDSNVCIDSKMPDPIL